MKHLTLAAVIAFSAALTTPCYADKDYNTDVDGFKIGFSASEFFDFLKSDEANNLYCRPMDKDNNVMCVHPTDDWGNIIYSFNFVDSNEKVKNINYISKSVSARGPGHRKNLVNNFIKYYNIGAGAKLSDSLTPNTLVFRGSSDSGLGVDLVYKGISSDHRTSFYVEIIYDISSVDLKIKNVGDSSK